MATISDRIITAPVGEFCQLSGLGRTKVYELLSKGTLDSITVGKRRLIIIASYRALIERQLGTPQERRAPPVPRRSQRIRALTAATV